MEIRLLGPVEVQVAGRALVVDTRKAVALLAYLAVTARPASRDVLAALLWPDAHGPDARAALRRTLSVLNAALSGSGLAIERHVVRLADTVEVDLHRFHALLDEVRRHEHPPGSACTGCMAALAGVMRIASGPFMDGFTLRDSETFDDWQRAEGEAVRRDLEAALERLARAALEAGDHALALAAGRRWLDLDPLHEPAHRLLMEAHARAGEPGAAIGQYRECVRVFDRELGVAPLAETTALYEAIRSGATSPRPPRDGAGAPSVPARLPLVGREAAMTALRAAHRSAGPDGRLVVIGGEPGIGKTRLASSFAEDVRAKGGIVLEARAYAGETAIPFAPIAGMLGAGLARPGAVERLGRLGTDRLAELARLVPVPGAGRSDPPDGLRAADPFAHGRLLEAVAEALVTLSAGSTPGVLWVDDLQWADASTLELIGYLFRRLHDRPVLVLLSCRREEVAGGELERLVEVAVRDGLATSVELRRLGATEVAELATTALGEAATSEYVDRLVIESEGLPLYVVEALATQAGGRLGIPGGVAALLRARMSAVGEISRQVASAGAVLGRSFGLETVREVSGRGEEETIDALEELARRGLVVEVGPIDAEVRYDFTHEGLRDVTYAALGLARRRLLHRRAAGALRTQAGDARAGSGAWSAIAHHEEMAGRTAEAADAHRRAADQARSVFANREAREHYEAALALGHPDQAELHELLGEVLTLLGEYGGAIGHLELAAATAPADRQAGIERRLGLVHVRLGDWPRADGHLRAALEAADPADATLRSAALADRSALAYRLGTPAAAASLAAEALDLALGSGDPAGVARAEDLLGILERGAGNLGAAEAHLVRSLAAAELGSDPGPRIAALNTLARVRAEAGDREAAIELTTQALALCERQGDRHRQAALENNLADLFEAGGDREASGRHLRRAVALFADIGGRPGELEPEIWKLVEW